MSKQEQVIAVRNRNVTKVGYSPAPEFLSLNDIFEPEDVMIGSRAWLEEDENFLQLIPYCIIKAGDKVLAYSRTAQGGETRLAGKVSCGIGGHINVADLVHTSEIINLSRTVYKSAYRELEEELLLPRDLDNPYAISFEGLLFDDSNPVGRVHLGLLMICELNSELHGVKHKITSEDAGINVLGFFDPEYLLSAEEVSLEVWSRMALEGLK